MVIMRKLFLLFLFSFLGFLTSLSVYAGDLDKQIPEWHPESGHDFQKASFNPVLKN